MLLGLIMYISVFKAEVGSKLRPRSQLLSPAFTYRYGFSFLLYVGGFIGTQMAGISAVFLFIYRMQHEWRQKHYEDLRRGKVRTPPPAVVHMDRTMYYPCRRHPQAYINSNSSIHVPINFPSPAHHQRRYFFSKDPVEESPCSLHRNVSHSNSLKDVNSGNFYDFPPPPTISYQFDELKSFNRDTSRHFPRDVTTNTVSTTADINCDDFLQEPYDDYSPSIQHEHEFVTFDLDQPLALRAQSSASVNSRNGNGRKDFCGGDTLRRTTPV